MEKVKLFGVCPYVTSQKVMTGKWSMYIMYVLRSGPISFNELLRQMPEDMTHATLSKQLKKLEDEGLIVRRVYSEIPPKVEYEMSEIGHRFEIVLDALEIWGNEYIAFIKQGKAPKMAELIESKRM